MFDWGPTVALVVTGRGCTVYVAYTFKRDRRLGCMGTPTFPGRSSVCLDKTHTFKCVLDTYGAYSCATHADFPALRMVNAAISPTGHLTLNQPLSGLPTPRLTWQRRYTFRNGFIYPWSTAGRLRPGLTLIGNLRSRCSPTSEETAAVSALRCFASSILVDPCFPQRSGWQHGGVAAACATAPGSTRFLRLIISGAT